MWLCRFRIRVTAALALVMLAVIPANTPLKAQLWDVIPPANLSTIGLDAFADDEIDLPYYVAHFHQLATSVERDEPNRGFIIAPVWGPLTDHKPHNARVMENILSLAFFYSTERPWNPWYASPQLRFRLEAALSHWLSLQNGDGFFSELEPNERSLSATAFATKFMGETLHYLKEGPAVNEDLVRQVAAADRKAIIAVLYGAPEYEAGKQQASDYSAIWAGTLAYLDLYPDEEIRKTMETRLRSSMKDFQSPFGYFYESGGPDMGKNLGPHLSNLRMAWHYARGGPYEPLFVNKMKEFYVWLVWNVSIETDRVGYYLNSAINTRTPKSYLAMDAGMPHQNGDPLSEFVRLARAFSLDKSAYTEWVTNKRAQLASSWPNVPEMEVGTEDAFSPLPFLHRRHYDFHAERELVRDALSALPCWETHPFNHIKKVEQENLLFYYASRSNGYYLAFAGGEAQRPQQTLGITLLRSHKDGTVMLGRPGSGNFAWGTRPGSSEDVYESTRVAPDFESDKQKVEIKGGPNSLPEGDVVLSYAIGEGTKTISLRKDRVDVEIRHAGPFTEQLPLTPKDGGRVELKGSRATFEHVRVEFNGASGELGETQNLEGPRKLQMLLLNGKDSLSYSIRF